MTSIVRTTLGVPAFPSALSGPNGWTAGEEFDRRERRGHRGKSGSALVNGLSLCPLSPLWSKLRVSWTPLLFEEGLPNRDTG